MARVAKYPRQHVVTLTVEQSDRLLKDAEENQLSQSEVARSYFELAFGVIDQVDETVDAE